MCSRRRQQAADRRRRGGARALFVARRLDAVRTHEEEPAPDAVRHALRDVIAQCIYGVDINPMAVELCRVALWMEALEPGKPLSFLEYHVQCGNSLLGTTPALLEKGIPAGAFEPIEGDDKAYCREWKRKNKEDRTGQKRLFEEAAPWDHLGNLGAAMAQLDAMPEDTAGQVRAKEQQYRELCAEGHYRKYGGLLADLWCAALVWKKSRAFDYPITERAFCQVEARPSDITPWMYDEVRRLARQYQFFHWHLAFPSVFRYPAKGERPTNEQAGWCGGFDVVLGNPPWERIKLQEQEWFAAHGRPDIAGARTAAVRGKMIRDLTTSDPTLHQAFLDDRRKAEGESQLARESGAFPLCGRGDVNTYSLFAELNRNLINPTGRVGCIVPTGIATDDTTKVFFQDVVQSGSLASLFGFENEEFIFPGVHHSTKFCLLTMAGAQRAHRRIDFVFFARQVEHLADPERRFSLAADDLRLLSPNTGTCPVFRWARDAVLSKAIYHRVPVLIREGDEPANPWGIRFMAMLHMANDSGLFRTAKDLTADGWELDGNVFRKDTAAYLPLYEAKMFHQFDHRWGTYDGQTEAQANQGKLPELAPDQHADPSRLALPRYWVPAREVADRLRDRWRRDWLLGWRDVCRNTDMRTTIASVLPRVGVGHTSPLMLPDASPPAVACLYASICSFVFDYTTRQKVGGTHLTFGLLNQLPALPPARYAESRTWTAGKPLSSWLLPRVLELTYTAYDLRPFAEDCGFRGEPFRWDEERRFQIRCELDAAFFALYLGAGEWRDAPGEVEADFTRLKEAFPTPRDAVVYIMDTFPVVRKADEEKHGHYRTKETVLQLYDELASGRPFESPLEPPPGSLGEEEAEEGPALDLFGDPLNPPTTEGLVIEAFKDVREGWSSEYVVCSPVFERRFHEHIKALAPWLKPENANLTLWNARRSGKLSQFTPSKRHSPTKELAPYEFVCEWAYRHLIAELIGHGFGPRATTLERILCNREWRDRFDELVQRIKPGFSLLDYRWVAMRVRKRSRKLRQGPPSPFAEKMAAAEAPKRLPDGPGLYLIHSEAEQLYTGWAMNLREQANRLVDAGQGTIIPLWLLRGRAPARTVAFEEVARGTAETRLHDLWRANLRAGRPLLNLLDEPAA